MDRPLSALSGRILTGKRLERKHTDFCAEFAGEPHRRHEFLVLVPEARILVSTRAAAQHGWRLDSHGGAAAATVAYSRSIGADVQHQWRTVPAWVRNTLLRVMNTVA
jgi:hypothetical protein